MRLLDTNVVSAFLKPAATGKGSSVAAYVSNLLATEELSIAHVTQFELRRGVEELVRRGRGRRRKVALEQFLERVEVLGLDAPGGGGWNLAAGFWAKGRTLSPARVFSEADLLIATTAAFHKRPFVTADKKLADGLAEIAFPTPVELLRFA